METQTEKKLDIVYFCFTISTIIILTLLIMGKLIFPIILMSINTILFIYVRHLFKTNKQ